MISILVITIIICVIVFQQHDASRLFVAKKGDSFVCFILQVAKADDISVSLNRIKYAVGTRERLYQPVHLEIFIHPKSIERCRVKAG